ncbi:MAG TPA: hypothetical protein VLM40_22355 [Gemmata sp.]|nr:hypothetical protein [Gemmata sp.]
MSCRTALAEARYPLFFYTAVDYPYTPSDIRALLDRINLKDEAFGKQPDLISGCRTGIPAPPALWWLVKGWKLLWRVFAGLPTSPSSPWHGWREFRYRTYSRWVFGVPLSDINSCFKLFRTNFLKRVPIQSNGDFVHTELVAKATFLTSIMDEVPLTPKPDAVPALGEIRADKRRVFRDPQFRVPPAPGDTPSGDESPAAAASASSTPSPVPLP